jgi:hypothetical protein
MLAKLETELPPINSMMETLGELRQECRKLNLRLAQAALDRFGDTLGTLGGKTPVEIAGVLKPFVYDLNLRVWDELKDTSFLLIQPGHAKLYKPR